MRIAYVLADRGISPAGRNGASTHVREVIKGLTAAGADVRLLMPEPAAGHGLEHDPIAYERDPMPSKLRRTTTAIEDGAQAGQQASEFHGLALNELLFEQLTALHAERPIDLIYERQSLWSYAGVRFAKTVGVPFFLEVNAPLVAQQEQYRALYNSAIARGIERVLLAEADRVIVPSRVLVDHVVRSGCPRRRVRVIPCGVSRALLAPAVRIRPSAGLDKPFVVGFLGSLKPWHGIERLVSAFQRLMDIHPGYRLLVVGDGPLRQVVEECRRACSDPECVRITGEVRHEEVAGYLREMDVGVAPYPELPGFYFSPLKIFEYAAAGVPIVAARSGQIAEVLTHRQSALLHPPAMPGKIVRHIERLRTRPELRARIARRAHRIVAARYTWDHLARRLLSIARNCIARM